MTMRVTLELQPRCLQDDSAKTKFKKFGTIGQGDTFAHFFLFCFIWRYQSIYREICMFKTPFEWWEDHIAFIARWLYTRIDVFMAFIFGFHRCNNRNSSPVFHTGPWKPSWGWVVVVLGRRCWAVPLANAEPPQHIPLIRAQHQRHCLFQSLGESHNLSRDISAAPQRMYAPANYQLCAFTELFNRSSLIMLSPVNRTRILSAPRNANLAEAEEFGCSYNLCFCLCKLVCKCRVLERVNACRRALCVFFFSPVNCEVRDRVL